MCITVPVPPVKHESDLKTNKNYGVSMSQCLIEIEKYLKFVHNEFIDFQHFQREKDDCINIFEKEVEELSKSWASLQDERRYIKKKRNRGRSQADPNAVSEDAGKPRSMAP